MIEISAADGQSFSAYRADPAGKPKGAVVVVQEIYGVNGHIRKLADEFAAQGYLAIAPALFDRVRKDVALAYDEAGTAAGLELIGRLDNDTTLRDIQATVDAVRDAGKVAIVGYSWGGHLAYQAANAVSGLACAVAYYGGGIADEWRGKRRIPTLLHFGVKDQYIPFDRALAFRANRPDACVFDYPAGHGFNCDERASYDAAAAQLARERTLAWISQFVVGQPPLTLKNAGAYAQSRGNKKKKAAGGDDVGPPPA